MTNNDICMRRLEVKDNVGSSLSIFMLISKEIQQK